MLSKEEFYKWCERLRLSDDTIQLIERIRNSEPSRNVQGGRGNIIGAYPSKKMGVVIHFESHTVELPGIYLKEHDDSVLEYYDQPPQIQLRYKAGKNEKLVAPYHTPDFFVMYKDKAGWEEWKTEEDLLKQAEKSPNRFVQINGVWHCPPGEGYAEKFGLHYWVKSSKEINQIVQRNLVFLRDYYLEV